MTLGLASPQSSPTTPAQGESFSHPAASRDNSPASGGNASPEDDPVTHQPPEDEVCMTSFASDLMDWAAHMHA